MKKILILSFLFLISFGVNTSVNAWSFYGDDYESNLEIASQNLSSNNPEDTQEIETLGFTENVILGIETTNYSYNIPDSLSGFQNFLLNTCGFSKPKTIDALVKNLGLDTDYINPLYLDLFLEKAEQFSNENYVSLAYQCVLLRLPDLEEMEENLGVLQAYKYDDTRIFLAESLVTSPEFTEIVLPKLSKLK